MNINLPIVELGFYSPVDVAKNQKLAKAIMDSFGNEISFAAEKTKVPQKLILALILAESAGKKDVIAKSGAIGLMQVKTQTANDTIFLEFQKKRLSLDELSYITTKLGSRLQGITKMKYLSQKLPENQNTANVITKNDLLDPKFNIFCGSLLMGLLIDQDSSKNGLRIDKSLFRYNQGYFSKPTGSSVKETLAFAKKKSLESYNYILKIAGSNGILQSISS